jgi:hypothetical protein
MAAVRPMISWWQTARCRVEPQVQHASFDGVGECPYCNAVKLTSLNATVIDLTDASDEITTQSGIAVTPQRMPVHPAIRATTTGRVAEGVTAAFAREEIRAKRNHSIIRDRAARNAVPLPANIGGNQPLIKGALPIQVQICEVETEVVHSKSLGSDNHTYHNWQKFRGRKPPDQV